MEKSKAIEILKDFNDYRRNQGCYDVDKPCAPKFSAKEIGEAIDIGINALIESDVNDMTIFDAVVAETGYSVRRLKGPGRERALVVARSVASWMMRNDGYTFQEIGDAFNRSHASIMHLLDEVDYWMLDQKNYGRELRLLERVKRRVGNKQKKSGDA